MSMEAVAIIGALTQHVVEWEPIRGSYGWVCCPTCEAETTQGRKARARHKADCSRAAALTAAERYVDASEQLDKAHGRSR